MQNLKNYAISAMLILTLCYASYIVGHWRAGNQGSVVPPSAGITADLSYDCKGPLRVYDKRELAKRDILPSSVARDSTAQATATGTLHGSDGTTHVTAILDEKNGRSVIIQERPTMEFLKANAVGIGVELNPRGMEREAYYRRTFARIFDGYSSVTLGGRERKDEKELFIKVNAEWHF